MNALALALLIAAPPVSDALAGSPEPQLRVADEPARGVVPSGWFRDREYTSALTDRLFTLSESGPIGEIVGTACELHTPEKFAYSHLDLRAKKLPWAITSSSRRVFFPAVVERDLSLVVWRNEARGKDWVREVALGVMTLGLSTLRLLPTTAATISVPMRGRTTGNFWAECRPVGQSSVNDALADLQKQRAKPCGDFACLRAEAALLGPTHPAVLEMAQAFVDAGAREAALWRKRASWHLASFDITAVTHCGKDCVKFTVINRAPVALRFPSITRGRDALGREVTSTACSAFDPIPAGQTRTCSISIKVTETDQPPRFPVVLRVFDDEWVRAVPGTFLEEGVLYAFEPSVCEGNQVHLDVTARRFQSGSELMIAYLSNGEATALHVPSGPFAKGEAYAYLLDATNCTPITAVSGRVFEPRDVLVP